MGQEATPVPQNERPPQPGTRSFSLKLLPQALWVGSSSIPRCDDPFEPPHSWHAPSAPLPSALQAPGPSVPVSSQPAWVGAVRFAAGPRAAHANLPRGPVLISEKYLRGSEGPLCLFANKVNHFLPLPGCCCLLQTHIKKAWGGIAASLQISLRVSIHGCLRSPFIWEVLFFPSLCGVQVRTASQLAARCFLLPLAQFQCS